MTTKNETYTAQILADSVSPDGVRLTTMWVTFPRFILAEVNTHRMFSRNSNSSRAIPPEIQLQKVRENPFVPETFLKRVKGMGGGEALEDDDNDKARNVWLHAADRAVNAAELLVGLDCDKARVNRLLEPFLWHSAVISATEWDNFFTLRDHPAAQPEFRIIAKLMRKAMDKSTPVLIPYGQWHLPGVTTQELFGQFDNNIDWEMWKRVSAGRLARWTSYNLTEGDTVEKALERAEKLIKSFHMSPTEHQARPFSPEELELSKVHVRMLKHWRDVGAHVPQWMIDQCEFSGNFKGWVQFRKEIPNEHNAALATNLA